MTRSKARPFILALAALVLGLVAATGTGHAWSWGAEHNGNEEFNPEHEAEILDYGCGIGSDWRAQILEKKAYATTKAPAKGADAVQRPNARERGANGAAVSD
jgi:hypothetical protein